MHTKGGKISEVKIELRTYEVEIKVVFLERIAQASARLGVVAAHATEGSHGSQHPPRGGLGPPGSEAPGGCWF